MRKKLILVMLLSITVPFIMAPGPPPPPEPSDCSPGYFKNHTEVWEGHGCGGTALNDAVLLDMLTP